MLSTAETKLVANGLRTSRAADGAATRESGAAVAMELLTVPSLVEDNTPQRLLELAVLAGPAPRRDEASTSSPTARSRTQERSMS